MSNSVKPDTSVPLHTVLAEELTHILPEAKLAGTSLSDTRKRIHEAESPLNALCISGGGIRSATFALGALQGLAQQKILGKFHYLSTVSGGGYIGSWLAAWMKREAPQAVFDQITPGFHPQAGVPSKSGEAPPIAHLRAYNNFLSPRLGALSADTWSLIATMIRNISLNWLVIVPLLAAVLMVPRILLSLATIGEAYCAVHGSALAVSDSFFVDEVLPVSCLVLLAITFFSMARYIPGVGGAKCSDASFLRSVLFPLVGSAIAFTAWDSLDFWDDMYLVSGIPVQTPFLSLAPWALAAAGASWIAFMVVHRMPFRTWIGLLFSPLSGAFFCMAASMGSLAWFLANKVLPETTWAQYITIAPPALVLSADVGIMLFVGFSSAVANDDAREWLARCSAWLKIFAAGWVGLCALSLLLPGVVFGWAGWQQGILGAAGLAGAWFSRVSQMGSGKSAIAEKIRANLPSIGSIVALLLFCLGISLVTNLALNSLGGVTPRGPFEKTCLVTGSGPIEWYQHASLLDHTIWWAVLGGAALLSLFGAVMATFMDINKFSLHDMYRNRLVRAYLRASNQNPADVDVFTNFAKSDDLPLSELARKPFLVVNTALNLVGSQQLAWQQRKAQSFTMSPLHCGNLDLGYRPSSQYGGKGGISLGTAMTISGAAASPSMGYHSSFLVGLVMTLLNARLGAWLGNPGPAGERTWTHSGPQAAARWLTTEALGLTANDSPYIYLSDGGHFENLAIYEMVLRRCRNIVVLDAGCDPDFGYEDLGNALRKIRIDQGIDIEFDEEGMKQLREKKKRYATAVIHYSSADGAGVPDGKLIYVKPMLRGNEATDVRSYATESTTFPHESTADQFFDETQTESYRMLGLQSVTETFGDDSELSAIFGV